MTNSVNIHFEKKKAINTDKTTATTPVTPETQATRQAIDEKVAAMPKEHGGRPKDKGLEPTRYGDWEFKGRCIDF